MTSVVPDLTETSTRPDPAPSRYSTPRRQPSTSAAPIPAGRAGVTGIAEYDRVMRQRAADTRDVIIRSGFAAPCDRPRQLVFTDSRGRVKVVDLGRDTAPLQARSAGTVIDLLEAQLPVQGRPDLTRPLPVLFADDATVRRVVAGFRRAADRSEAERRRYVSAANRLTLVASMKFSVLRPVLTRILAHRFWLPVRHNPHRWQDWAAAWSGTARVARTAGQAELLNALVGLAFDHGGDRPLPDELLTTLAVKEAMAWARAASSHATHTHSTYRAVTAFEAAWAEATMADSCLAERNTLSGDIAVGHVDQIATKVRLVLDNTPRFNESALWAVIDGTRHKVNRDAMLAGDDNALSILLQVPPRAVGAFREARRNRSVVTLYPQRFAMPAATPAADNTWLNEPQTAWTRRDVPADVLLAGADVDG